MHGGVHSNGDRNDYGSRQSELDERKREKFQTARPYEPDHSLTALPFDLLPPTPHNRAGLLLCQSAY